MARGLLFSRHEGVYAMITSVMGLILISCLIVFGS